MASVEVVIAGRRHDLFCRDGEEAHLRAIARIVDEKATTLARTMHGLSEARLMLLAALLLADELADARAAAAPIPPADLATALERIADRMEALAARTEGGEGLRPAPQHPR